MILKGSQRGGGADLAIHLMNGFDNERIELAEVYGTVAGDLFGAFAEFEAVAQGTKAREYLYSLSISPPQPMTREQYYEAIETIEQGLGLDDQPRAVVFHVKHGREHCHVVWSRIDVENMRAIHLSFDHSRLMDLACSLCHRFGFELPQGLKDWEAGLRHDKEELEPTLAENAQEQATGITPEERRAEITAAYNQSDTARAFVSALEQKGYILARGDRRDYVIVDRFGNVHSLTRHIKDHKPRAIRAKLAALAGDTLPSVDEAKELAAQRRQAGQEREREQTREERRRELTSELERKFAAHRAKLARDEQQLLTLQQSERLALHAAQLSESKGLLFRARSAVADLIAHTPGLRSVLSHIQKLTSLDPRERHRLENEALDRRHGRERSEIERHKRFIARIETREKQSLEKALQREWEIEQAQTLSRQKTDDLLAKDARRFAEGELSTTFNDHAGFEEREHGSDGGDDEGQAAEQESKAQDDDDGGGPKHRRRRGKGYGYRRDSD